MNRAELLAKIRKCLALAKSANEHEAAAALGKARELMDAYGLDHDDVAFSEVEERPASGNQAQKPPRWEVCLLATVKRAISCEAHLDIAGRWIFIGLAPAPEIAAYAFAVLYRQLKRARGEYVRSRLRRCGLARKRQRADIFCEGWADAVFGKIARVYPKPAPDPIVGRYIAEHHPGLVPADMRVAKLKGTGAAGSNDFWNGWDRGREADLHRGMSGSAEGPKLIGGANG